MKILELRFKNLNSLYGEWHIDFTAPEYEGIFALTGPTGAGKSTILDALCLALYGATPRLGKITQSGNEIMTRRTAECYAELVFHSREGRYRCRWDQWRSRRKADGALQAPEHQIAEAGSGTILESKRSRVGAVIEEKTGMDFERFTRSVLLAQGSFDSFLKADAEKKSSILEQITGTAVYTDISRRVHEHLRQKKEGLEVLEASISGIPLLSDEEAEQLRQDLEEKIRAGETLEAGRKKSAEAVTWRKTVAALMDEMKRLDREEEEHRRESEAFAPEAGRLTEARRAAARDPDFAALCSGRRQLSSDAEALKGVRETLPSLESAFKEQNALLQSAERETRKARKKQQEAAPRIKQVRAMDQSLAELNRSIARNGKKVGELERELEELSTLRNREEQSLEKTREETRESEAYLREHSCDKVLVGSLAGIEELLSSLLSRQQEILRRGKELKEAETELNRCEEALKKRKSEGKEAQKKGESIQEALDTQKKELETILDGRLLREYRSEKEALLREKSLRERIASLEEHRASLEDGSPCPLCGSTRHPYAEGNIPAADETEDRIHAVSNLIQRAETQEQALKITDEKLRRAADERQSLEIRLAAGEQEKRSALKVLETARKADDESRSNFEELKSRCLEQLQPLGIEEFPQQKISFLLRELKERLKAWNRHSALAEDSEKQIMAHEGELKRLDEVLKMRNETRSALTGEMKNLKVDHMTVTTNRWTLFEEKDPDAEEQRLSALIDAAEKRERNERSTLEIGQGRLQTARSRDETLSQRIDAQREELKALEEKFSAALKDGNFADEQDFLKKRLSPEELNRLSERSRALEDRATEIRARKEDRRTRLAGEQKRNLSPRPLEELEEELRLQEEALKILREETAGIRQRLSSHRKAEEDLKEKRTALERQKKECRRWKKLHELIGSADGKKYRNFAQGLTFELMVGHANRQLEKMSERYLLLRDGEDPLALNVLDNYQAGEIRSVKNLSGGESFIISLSLALGLSRMASRKVRVDSLFLDEGFGTLDEDALETALETLAELHQDGKTIGIISHVAALKERISTRIAVNPASGGRSTVSGPGCRRITVEAGD